MDIIQRLVDISDADYAKSAAVFFPNLDPASVLGCRAPDLQKLAKELSKDEARFDFMDRPHYYLEEKNIHGLLLNSVSKDIDVVLEYVEKFLPWVDNWGTCDGTVCSLKIFKKYPDKVYGKALEWMKSKNPYTVRFGVVTLLCYFLDGEFREETPYIVAKIDSEEYYLKMAVAWYFSTALAKQYDKVIGIIESRTMPKWVHNKAIQKSIESFRITPEKKEYLRSLKIK